jgi:hypothetical protein
MSNNNLIAFCVGAMFLLAVIVVVGSLLDRKHSRQMLTMLTKAAYNPGRYVHEDTYEDTQVKVPQTVNDPPWPIPPKE